MIKPKIARLFVTRSGTRSLSAASLVNNSQKFFNHEIRCAVVTGREHLKGTYKGHTGEFMIRFTNVFIYRDKRWQMITHHATEIKKKEEQ